MTNNPFLSILQQYWGYDRFRPLQQEIISSVYEGKDTLGLMPTGGGKSLTFQVPVMLMEGICIVVTPLIALMKDQVDNLRQRGIKATAVYSGMSHNEIIVALENCIFGDYKFLYISPERLNSELFLVKLKDMQVCLLVVDESHCISQWGYDFRPAYLQIASIRDHLPGVSVLALTATATEEVIDDIQEKLNFRKKNVFRKSFERKNLAYIVRKTEDKLFEMVKILNNVPGSGIVYVRSRKRTKDIALELQSQGIDADFFHAGLNIDEKQQRQNRWKTGECRIMVCTNAFGMGIDKPDVRVVIHYELPGSLEEYFQEAGRAGRDEQKAYAVALYSEKDAGRLMKQIHDEFPDRDYIKDIYEKLAFFYQIAAHSGFQTTHLFELEKFCATFKFSYTQAVHALHLLQLSGYLELTDDPDNRSRLIFTIHRDELYNYSGFSKETDDLVQAVLRTYTGLFSDYVFINESVLATRTGMNRMQVYEILKSLSAQRVIHYIPASQLPLITYLQNREETSRIVIPKSVYEQRKERLEQRVRSVLSYGMQATECRSISLLRYFGEKKAEECRQCDVCLKKQENGLPAYLFNRITRDVLKIVETNACSLDQLIKQLEYPEDSVLKTIRFLDESGVVYLSDNYVTKKRPS